MAVYHPSEELIHKLELRESDIHEWHERLGAGLPSDAPLTDQAPPQVMSD